MKKVMFTALFLFLGIGLFAQQAHFGIKGGLNYGATGDYESFSQVTGDLPFSEDGEERAGFHIGLYSKLEFLGIFLQPELLYTQLNTKYSNFKYKVDKLDLPVLIGLKIIGPLEIKAGPSFQYILNNDLEDTNASIGDVQDDISVGYQLGAGINLGRLGFDVRYEGAFSENNAFGEAATDHNFRIDSRPSQWILSVSYDLN